MANYKYPPSSFKKRGVKMSLHSMDRKVALVIMAISIIYLLLSYQLPHYPYTQVDADVLPKGLGFLLLGLAILSLHPEST